MTATEKVTQLQKLRDDLIAFLDSPIHKLYLDGTKQTLTLVEDRILNDDLNNLSDLMSLLELRGQRRVIQSNIELFEDAAVTLDGRIEEILIAENKEQHNTETNETE